MSYDEDAVRNAQPAREKGKQNVSRYHDRLVGRSAVQRLSCRERDEERENENYEKRFSFDRLCQTKTYFLFLSFYQLLSPFFAFFESFYGRWLFKLGR